MQCLRCARDIETDSEFCRYCGGSQQSQQTPPSLPPPRAKRLRRLPAEGTIAGVCAGLAAFFGVDVTFVRLAWVILSIVPGGLIGGLVAYVVAWALVPEQAGMIPATGGRRLRRSATDVTIAGVCSGIADYFDVDPTVVRLIWAVLTIIPGAIILGVFAYLVAWVVIPRASTTRLHPAPSPL